MLRRRIAARTLLLVAITLALEAQAVTVRGRVERQTSAGLVNAGYVRVTISGQSGSRSSPSYTDPQGIYYIYNVPPGVYTLEIWSGPKPVTAPISVTNVPIFIAPSVTVR